MTNVSAQTLRNQFLTNVLAKTPRKLPNVRATTITTTTYHCGEDFKDYFKDFAGSSEDVKDNVLRILQGRIQRLGGPRGALPPPKEAQNP